MLTLKQQKLLLELFPDKKLRKQQFHTYKSVRFFENMGELVEMGLVLRRKKGKDTVYELSVDGRIFASWVKEFWE